MSKSPRRLVMQSPEAVRADPGANQPLPALPGLPQLSQQAVIVLAVRDQVNHVAAIADIAPGLAILAGFR